MKRKDRKFLIQINPTTREHRVWLSVQEAARQFIEDKQKRGRPREDSAEPGARLRGICSNIYGCCEGRFESAYGHKWAMVDGVGGLNLAAIEDLVANASLLYAVQAIDWKTVSPATLGQVLGIYNNAIERGA
jgi:hypothetical protein